MFNNPCVRFRLTIESPDNDDADDDALDPVSRSQQDNNAESILLQLNQYQ